MLADINNELLTAVLDAFFSRFTPEGRVLWVSENDEPVLAFRDELHQAGVSFSQPRSLPNVVIDDGKHERLALIDVADLRGLMTESRREALNEMFGESRTQLVLVNAFRNRKQFQTLAIELPWDTVVWFSDEPDHLIHFNGERFLGPYSDALAQPPSV